MAKPKTLLDELKASRPAPASGPRPWHEKFRDTNPDMMQQVDEIIDAFHANEPMVRSRRPTKQSLAKFLESKLGFKMSSTKRYIDERADGTTR